MPPRLAQPSHTRHRRRDRHEQESTKPLQDPRASALDYLPQLLIGFNNIPRTDKSHIFRSNKNYDVQLPYLGISNIHFSLTFDKFNRPVIKDLNSLKGTQITYNSGSEGVRRDFCWIVGGHDIPQKMESIIITVPNAVSFQIVTQSHDTQSPEYVDGIKRFLRGTTTTKNLLDRLGLSNPPTRGAQTPGTRDISLRKTLSEGSFGVVTHLWNVSTGKKRVVKSPSPKAIQKRQFNPAA